MSSVSSVVRYLFSRGSRISRSKPLPLSVLCSLSVLSERELQFRPVARIRVHRRSSFGYAQDGVCGCIAFMSFVVTIIDKAVGGAHPTADAPT